MADPTTFADQARKQPDAARDTPSIEAPHGVLRQSSDKPRRTPEFIS
jgi:hypothetical protein